MKRRHEILAVFAIVSALIMGMRIIPYIQGLYYQLHYQNKLNQLVETDKPLAHNLVTQPSRHLMDHQLEPIEWDWQNVVPIEQLTLPPKIRSTAEACGAEIGQFGYEPYSQVLYVSVFCPIVLEKPTDPTPLRSVEDDGFIQSAIDHSDWNWSYHFTSYGFARWQHPSPHMPTFYIGLPNVYPGIETPYLGPFYPDDNRVMRADERLFHRGIVEEINQLSNQNFVLEDLRFIREIPVLYLGSPEYGYWYFLHYQNDENLRAFLPEITCERSAFAAHKVCYSSNQLNMLNPSEVSCPEGRVPMIYLKDQTFHCADTNHQYFREELNIPFAEFEIQPTVFPTREIPQDYYCLEGMTPVIRRSDGVYSCQMGEANDIDQNRYQIIVH